VDLLLGHALLNPPDWDASSLYRGARVPRPGRILRFVRREFSLAFVLGSLIVYAVAVHFVTVVPDGAHERATLRADYESMEKALKLYRLQTGDYPRSLEELWNPTEAAIVEHGYFLEQRPRDPWGRPYRYRATRVLDATSTPRTCAAWQIPHGCPTPGRAVQASYFGALARTPDDTPALYSLGADGQPGGEGEDADWLWAHGYVQGVDWQGEVESDLRVIRRAIGAWEQAHPGSRLSDLHQLPDYARRLDPWGTPYVFLPETSLGSASAGFAGRHDPGYYVLFSLGADRAWGGQGLDGERGWSSRTGAFSPEAPLAAGERSVLPGILAGASVILLPSGVLLLLAWVRLRRRRLNAVPPPEVLVSLGGRCAYCHDDGFGVVAPCPGCGSLLHGSCWLEVEECPTLGCGARPNASFALRRPPATIKAGEAEVLAAPPALADALPRSA